MLTVKALLCLVLGYFVYTQGSFLVTFFGEFFRLLILVTCVAYAIVCVICKFKRMSTKEFLKSLFAKKHLEDDQSEEIFSKEVEIPKESEVKIPKGDSSKRRRFREEEEETSYLRVPIKGMSNDKVISLEELQKILIGIEPTPIDTIQEKPILKHRSRRAQYEDCEEEES